MSEKGNIIPKPYARILSMIGDQIIRNEKLALLEIIKNSYDADATWVQIRFNNFEFDEKKEILKIKKDSSIEIEDDGNGMTFDIITDSWANPASPFKYFLKKEGKDKTKLGRIIQGEKGIGRFAVLKLGSTIEIITVSKEKPNKEISVKSDLSIYDEELLSKKQNGENNPVFMEDLRYAYEIKDEPEIIIEKEIIIQHQKIRRNPHGTLIKITNVNGDWNREKIQNIFDDCLKLVSPYNKTDFLIDITVNGESFLSTTSEDSLNNLLKLAILKMKGSITKDWIFNISINNKKKKLRLDDFKPSTEFRKRFVDEKTGRIKRYPECGIFNFNFHVFNLNKNLHIGAELNPFERELIKKHRIYLYRDGVRIHPYGDPRDDWLQIDILRGTKKAGSYLSNNDVVGRISISSENNPNLKDKADREGLRDIGNAFEDFRVIGLVMLGYLKKEFDKLKRDHELKREHRAKRSGLFIKEPKVEKKIITLIEYLEQKKDYKGKEITNKVDKEYKKEKKILTDRAEIVEDLAAVGLTVETASHDLMIMMSRAKETVNILTKISDIDPIEKKKLKEEIDKLRGQIAFIEDQLQGIQPLFRSSRRKSSNLRIKDMIKKVEKYYLVALKKKKIELVVEEHGPPLVVKTVEAVLLQLFINLFDNSVYWLSLSDKKRLIKVIINGTKFDVVFADNGSGIRKEDAPYIFTQFFSTKGIQGRGLGLYIARQLLERQDFEIDLIEKDTKKISKGANFLINFSDNEDKR